MIPSGRFEIADVAPVGTERAAQIACGSGGCVASEVEVETYPARAEAEELRAARQGAALSHRQAGALLGIDARILCALEFRRMTFVDPAGWRWAIDVLRAANVARSGAGGGYVMPFYIRCTLDCGDDLEWYQGHVDGRDVFVSTAERHEKAKPFATAEAGAAFITGTWGRRRRGRQPKVPRVQPFEVVEAPPPAGGT